MLPQAEWRFVFGFLGVMNHSKRSFEISAFPSGAWEREGTRARFRLVPKRIGVKAIDRIPEDFYDFKLNEPNLATALVLFVETEPKVWKEFYVNNWFHKWGDRADKAIAALYADKKAPYDIYGFWNAQAAPFDRKSQAIIEQFKDQSPSTFHGRIKSTKDNAFGYEIELIDLIGKNVKTGGHKVLYGDAKTIPLLDGKGPEKK